MEFLTVILLLSSLVLIYVRLTNRRNSSHKSSAKLPPGPFPFPIIGNILQLGRNPHRSLAKLSQIYGPIMRLKLGSKQVIVVSSPEMAKEVLQKHDQICSGRVVPYVVEALGHHHSSVVWLPAGKKWRMFRKTCKEHMFTAQKMEASEGLRQQKLRELRGYLQECCVSRRIVNVGEVAFVTLLNLVSATLFSVDFARFDSDSDPDSGSVKELREIVSGVVKISGTPNVADLFPVLKRFDPQGLKRKSADYGIRLQAQFGDIINERMYSRYINSSDSSKKEDLLQVLLDLNLENSDAELNMEDMQHLFGDLIVAGSETTTGTVIWVMSELISNPKKMRKVKDELKTVIGSDKQVQESDIPRLPYLNAVIKETLRCHPSLPFLIPHKAEADTEINGYLVPKDAEIVVNVWAIGRDSRIWSNPDSFEPERFLDSKTDYRGKDFELIPFGSGRRMCPGIPLAHLMLHLIVASMVHNFDWQPEAEELDMSDLFGLSLQRAVPLRAFPSNRRS